MSKKDNTAFKSNALYGDVNKSRKKYRRKRKNIAVAVVIISMLLLAVCGGLIFQYLKIGVVESITIEAGEQIPEPADFFERKGVSAEYFGDVIPDTTVPKQYEVKVRNGIMVYPVKVIVKDTVKPTAKTKNVRIKQGEKIIKPEDFLRDIKDETKVTAKFKTKTDGNLLGDTFVTIVLTDLGGNESEYKALLTVFPKELKKSVTVEAGITSLSLDDFLEEDAAEKKSGAIYTDMTDVTFNHVEKKNIQILYDDIVYTVPVNVEDTTVPAGYVINQRTYSGTPIPASDFIARFYDNTDVTVEYEKEPDFSKVGAEVITIILEDEGGNRQSYRVTIYISRDVTPPVITAENRTVYLGDNIRFTEGVTATDNNDGEVEVQVDISGFDRSTQGTYPVTFTAEDKSGNTATKTVYFTLAQKVTSTVAQYTIDQAFEQLFGSITNESMTERQKLRAIYEYIRENIAYNGTSDKTDSEQEAYRGITSLEGDSFTFYSVSKKLISFVNVEVKSVKRKNSESSHYWLMVKLDGKWLHFDACPHYKDYPLDSFLLTDEQAQAYSKKTNGYYDYETIK